MSSAARTRRSYRGCISFLRAGLGHGRDLPDRSAGAQRVEWRSSCRVRLMGGPCLVVAAAVEPSAMEGTRFNGVRVKKFNVVTLKKAEPTREPYRNSVGEKRV